MTEVFTAAEAAKICGVSRQTICKWFDGSLLHGYRLLSSGNRRIPHEHLLRFLKKSMACPPMPSNNRWKPDANRNAPALVSLRRPNHCHRYPSLLLPPRDLTPMTPAAERLETRTALAVAMPTVDGPTNAQDAAQFDQILAADTSGLSPDQLGDLVDALGGPPITISPTDNADLNAFDPSGAPPPGDAPTVVDSVLDLLFGTGSAPGIQNVPPDPGADPSGMPNGDQAFAPDPLAPVPVGPVSAF